MNKSELFVLLIALVSFFLGVYLFPQMPEKMASHWNAVGEVDGFMPKFWGIFLFPFILLLIGLFFIAIPRIDPLRENIEKFRKHYNGFIVLFSLFLLAVFLQVVLWNLGIKISPNFTLPIGVGLLFFYIGILCENAEQNWFIGIRTPWTLSSERVWNKTHRIGAKLFKAAGIIAFIGAVFPQYAMFFILVPALFTAGYTIIYSYFEYKKLSG